jgi:hypothetical protein
MFPSSSGFEARVQVLDLSPLRDARPWNLTTSLNYPISDRTCHRLRALGCGAMGVGSTGLLGVVNHNIPLEGPKVLPSHRRSER